jgi:alpha-ribazole phosphatase
VALVQTRWWWVRHAPVPDEGRIYGQRDLDCDCGDVDIFRTLAAELPAKAVWVTSSLARTKQTAAAILAAANGGHVGIEPVAIADLAEQHLGEWQGLERKAFYEKRSINTHALWFAPADERPPGGESFCDLVARVVSAIDRLNDEHRGRDIVAVTHGGTIRAALAQALAISPQTALAFSVENCSLTRIDHLRTNGGPRLWRVVAVNHRPWSRPGGKAATAPAGIDRA